MGIKSSVSLYSLQYQYLRGNMDLEQIVDYVMGLGADGIELLPDQMLKGTPTQVKRLTQHGIKLLKNIIRDLPAMIFS